MSMRWRFILIALPLCVVVGLISLGRHGNIDPVVRQWFVTDPNLPTMRLAVLGDFHFKAPEDLSQLSRIKRQLIEAKPDLILFVGDYLDLNAGANAPKPEAVGRALDALAFPTPAFAVLGNHDQPETRQWHRTFDDGAITLLENVVTSIQLKGHQICIRGLGDLYSQAWQFIDIPKDCVDGSITLTHDPAGLIQNDTQLESLSVAGHTHCGQIAFPFIGAPVVPTIAPPDMHCGGYQRGYFGLTTGGLGTSILPIRFGPRTEASWDLIHVNSTDSPKGDQ